MGHSIRESDGESFEDHGSGQEMTAASGPSTPLPFSLSFATPVANVCPGNRIGQTSIIHSVWGDQYVNSFSAFHQLTSQHMISVDLID
jgi:hypothetical protein